MRKGTWSEFRKHGARPERIVWAVAAHEGQRSICPLGWKMNASGSPLMMAISVAPQRFTHGLIERSGELVLAWPGEDLAEATLLCGTRSGRDIDKFKQTGLTPLPSEHIAAPLIAECVANLECRVTDRLTTGDHTLFACEILAVWLHDQPQRLCLSIDRAAGYDVLLDKDGRLFGAIKP